jgi:hypothetical protein
VRSHGTRMLLRRSRRSRRSCLRHSKSRDHSRAATTSPRSWPVRNLCGVHSFLSNSVLFLPLSLPILSLTPQRGMKEECEAMGHEVRPCTCSLSLSLSLCLSLALSSSIHLALHVVVCVRSFSLSCSHLLSLPFSFLSPFSCN